MKLLLCLAFASTAFADDSAKLAALLAKDGVVTIPAGDYHLDGTQPIPLRSLALLLEITPVSLTS